MWTVKSGYFPHRNSHTGGNSPNLGSTMPIWLGLPSCTSQRSGWGKHKCPLPARSLGVFLCGCESRSCSAVNVGELSAPQSSAVPKPGTRMPPPPSLSWRFRSLGTVVSVWILGAGRVSTCSAQAGPEHGKLQSCNSRLGWPIRGEKLTEARALD